MSDNLKQIEAALAAPFDVGEVKFRPGNVAKSGDRALALPYVDARVIQDRLDDVLGATGWQDSYRLLAGGCVRCRLRCRIGGEWIAKEDVGSPSDQPDAGDKLKAAFSDALKRAAVKFGIARYLYRLPQIWEAYDSQKKKFARDPRLPGQQPAPAERPAPNRPAPAQQPGPRKPQGQLEKPYDRDHDAAEIVDDGMVRYLLALSDRLGYRKQATVSAIKQRFNVLPHELTVGQYREALALLEGAGPRKEAKAS